MKIVFRTNTNGTLGHLARCRHLGRAMTAEGWQVHYLLDKNPEFKAAWLDTIAWQALYKDCGATFSSEIEDSHRCINELEKLKPDVVVVDDYRLAVMWEQSLADAGYKLLAIDDLRREHVADILLEPKPISSPDTRLHGKNTVLLTGPQYLLLDPAYAAYKQRPKFESFIVLLSLGGGGDLQFLHDCMRSLLEEFYDRSANGRFANLVLKPVLGPMGENADSVRQLASRFPEHIVPLEQPETIACHYQQANLFVGAAGTSIFEAAASMVPAVTFSMAENQCNSFSDLEQLGHYLHINQMPVDSARSLAQLIATLIHNYSRVKSLRNNAEVVLDGMGASRVAREINALVAGRATDETLKQRQYAQSLKCSHQLEQKKDTNDFSVRPCDDTDINRYLQARNLPANRSNMTTDAVIHSLHHYRWWFQTKRQSYSVSYNNEIVLYIWHEAVHSASCNLLVGGWFAASDHLDLMCVVKALDWQLALTDTACQGIPWIAIIKKTNRFVYTLNRRVGFKDAEMGSLYHNAISEYFSDANPEEFHYVYREAQVPELVDK